MYTDGLFRKFRLIRSNFVLEMGASENKGVIVAGVRANQTKCGGARAPLAQSSKAGVVRSRSAVLCTVVEKRKWSRENISGQTKNMSGTSETSERWA